MLGIADDTNAQKRRTKLSKKISKWEGGATPQYKGGFKPYNREGFKPYYFIGANINTGNYSGDLAPVNKNASTDISFTRPGFGFHGGYKFHHSLAIRGGLNWYRIFGDDFSSDPTDETSSARYTRNLSFRNDIKELQVGLEISLLPNHGGIDERLGINAFIFVGGVVYLHEPMGLVPDADYQKDKTGAVAAPQAGEWVKLRPLGTEGQNLGIVQPYSNFGFSIPISVGATLRVPGSDFNVGIEFGVRYLFTDYIDDVSTNYVGLNRFDDDVARILSDKSAVPISSTGKVRDLANINIARGNGTHDFFYATNIGAGSDGVTRGNPDSNDLIFVTQLKVTYLLFPTPNIDPKFQ